jgi:type IV secretion system protein VirB4
LLILDEAWVFLDDPLFSARIREWLKTLRKKNVSVVFATQSLADIERSSIAPALIESCPSRIFLPNDRAVEPQSRTIYEHFGLNDRQIELIASSIPKRDYYYQSQRGNRLFELGLGPVALALCGAGSSADQALIDDIKQQTTSDVGKRQSSSQGFASRWLNAIGLNWAADLLPGFNMEGSVTAQATPSDSASLINASSSRVADLEDQIEHIAEMMGDKPTHSELSSQISTPNPKESPYET